LKANISGPLNNLQFKKLKLTDSRNSHINRLLILKNLFGKEGQKFFMKTVTSDLSTSYANLVTMLCVLGKTAEKETGLFYIDRNTQLSKTDIDADFTNRY
jgi:hypothetical protein